MSRPVGFTVEDYGAFITGFSYPVTIVGIKAGGEFFEVTLRHMARMQEGRIQTLLISLPVRPDSIAGQFFKACGQDVVAGNRIKAKDVLGCAIRVLFRESSQGVLEVDRFEAVPREDNHEPDAQ